MNLLTLVFSWSTNFLLLLGGLSKLGSVRTWRGEVLWTCLIRFANRLGCPVGPDNGRAC